MNALTIADSSGGGGGAEKGPVSTDQLSMLVTPSDDMCNTPLCFSQVRMTLGMCWTR